MVYNLIIKNLNKEGEFMELETSKSILKIFGTLNIIFGIIGFLFGIFALAGGSLAGIGVASGEVQTDQNLKLGLGIALILGIYLIIAGIINVIEGILDRRAANDISKIMPAWVFSIIGLIDAAYSIYNIFTSTDRTVSNILGVAIAVVLSIITFMAANSIKAAAGK